MVSHQVPCSEEVPRGHRSHGRPPRPRPGHPPLAQVALGDIVRLYKPDQPVRGTDRQTGPLGFGIVAENLTVLPDGRARNVSLYLNDPARKELFLGPNGVPEFVDHHTSEFELYKRAEDMGVRPTRLTAPNRPRFSRGPAPPGLTVRPPASRAEHPPASTTGSTPRPAGKSSRKLTKVRGFRPLL